MKSGGRTVLARGLLYFTHPKVIVKGADCLKGLFETQPVGQYYQAQGWPGGHRQEYIVLIELRRLVA
jgi:hypothetical protein